MYIAKVSEVNWSGMESHGLRGVEGNWSALKCMDPHPSRSGNGLVVLCCVVLCCVVCCCVVVCCVLLSCEARCDVLLLRTYVSL